MKGKFIGIYHVSNLLTCFGIVIAMYGILVRDSKLSIISLVLAGVCDLFDGRFARSFKRDDRQKAYGIELDSLADVVSFGILPIVVLQNELSILKSSIYIIGAVYILAVVFRLAWFNITSFEYEGYHMGLPVTYSALLISLYYLISGHLIHNTLVKETGFIVLYISLMLFYILNIKIKKPNMFLMIVLGLLAIVVIVTILMF